MPTLNGISAASGSIFVPQTSTEPVTVATALARLRLKPGSTVAITDTLANIQKNLDALQGVAGRVSALNTSDAGQTLSVSAAQYQKDGAILARWGAGDGNTVEVTGVSAFNAVAFAAARPGHVSTFTVADSATNVQRKLDDLQTLVSGGSLRQITLTGASSTLKITAAQLTADQGALGAIRNQAYALAITQASVSDTLGLDGQAALSANARVKSIHVKDSTEAIETNLDALQRVGLRLKSISQTDPGTALTITGAQVWQDAVTLGKILSPYQLDVVRASAAQAAKLASNQKVVTVSVTDTAAHLAQRWSLLQRLSDSLTAVEVTDPANAITLSSDQLALSEDLLAKFSDDAEHDYRLAITGVKAGQAAAVAAVGHVATLKVADTADNIVAHLDDLKAVGDSGQLQGITLTGKKLVLAMDAARLQGDPLVATQGVLDKIGSGHYGLAVSGVSMDALDALADNRHVVALDVAGSGAEIADHLDALQRLGKRLARIQQSDAGTVFDLTHSAFESRAAVLAKIEGGYTVNITGASAHKALAAAMNSHVASVSVADSGRNLAANWTALRSIGATLAGVTQTDDGALSISATNYLAAGNDGLLARFAGSQAFDVHGASVAQATALAADAAVRQVELTVDGSSLVEGLAALGELLAGGKLGGITLNPGATNLALHAGQLDAAQGVLDLVKGGRYTLSLDEVEVADAGDLLASNAKVVRMKVRGDAAAITEHLAALAAGGRRLTGIEQTDAADSALALSGAVFEQHALTLAKIAGGYRADLSDVSAAKAASLAASTSVQTLAVSDSGARLAASWAALGALGDKLTVLTQTDAELLSLTATQWAASSGLADRFASPPAVSITGASVADLAGLADDAAVQQVQITDHAELITDAWSDLLAQSKLTQIRLSDPAVALALTAERFATSGDLLGRIPDGRYSLALSDVSVADAATLATDAHVTSMVVGGSAADVAALFADLSALDTVSGIVLDEDNGTLSLSAAQILGGTGTLAKIGNPFQLAATGVTLADLADIQAVDEVASIGISDSAATIQNQLDDILALGSALSGLHFTDDAPVLALSQADWTAGASAWALADGSFAVDLSDVQAADTATLAADARIRQLSVTDSAAAIASHWAALVEAYGEGAGKLSELTLSDDGALSLTAEQQTAGAALIAALLPDEAIVTAG